MKPACITNAGLAHGGVARVRLTAEPRLAHSDTHKYGIEPNARSPRT